MNVEILVVLFLVFSVISSLVSKFRDSRKRQEMDRPNRSIPRPRTVYQPDEKEIDLSEWEVFRDDSPETPQGEFREVHGERTVSESPTGEEFQEIKGKRSVDEPAENPKLGTTPVGRKSKGVKLGLSRKALRRAIIFNEVIGPPRADNMPW